MPMLTFKAIEVKDICKISKELIDELQGLIQCPREYFSIEAPQATYVKDGELVKGEAVVEVSWFDRGQEVQNKVAIIITKYVHSMGYNNVDVIFSVLKENRYYENGEHF